MKRTARVVVAMSGGVDSSLAAALLVEAGYEVVGVSMRLWEPRAGDAESGCCSLDDFLDARRVADHLRIPFYVFDFQEDFRRNVVEPFVSEYRLGRTPNPCARCNQFVKFSSYWERVRQLGGDLMATGHYARRREGAHGAELLRGIDAEKDQSYFLFSVERQALDRCLFPVGELTKTEVRSEALRRGLPVAAKPDSQEICFAPRGTHAGFVERHSAAQPPREGAVVDATGRVLARHRGVHLFTIGQRRGLGVSSGGAPRYVTDIDGRNGVVRVGSRAETLSEGLVAGGSNWLGPPPRPGQAVLVKIRSRFAPQPAVVTELGEDRFALTSPQGLRAVTPGQAAVLYDEDRVIGGGWIDHAIPGEAGWRHAAV